MTSRSHGCALTQGERSRDRDQQAGYFDSEPAAITGCRMVRNHRANSAFSSPDVVGAGEEDSDFEDVVEGTAASSPIAQQFPGACRRPALDKTVQHRIKRVRPTNVLFCRWPAVIFRDRHARQGGGRGVGVAPGFHHHEAGP